MKWTDKKRLELISSLVVQIIPRVKTGRNAEVIEITEKIAFLAIMEDDFLEASKDKFLQTRSAQQHNGAELGIQGGFTCKECGCANSGSFDTCAECDTPRPS